VIKIIAACESIFGALRSFFDWLSAARLKQAGRDAETILQREHDDEKSDKIVRAAEPRVDDADVVQDDGFRRD
jgi:hypothetical protein